MRGNGAGRQLESLRRGSTAAWRQLGSPSRPHRTGLKVRRHASRIRAPRIPSSPVRHAPPEHSYPLGRDRPEFPTHRTVRKREGGIGRSNPRFVSHPRFTMFDNRRYQWSGPDVGRTMRGTERRAVPRDRTGRARHRGGGGRGRARGAKPARRDFRVLCGPAIAAPRDQPGSLPVTGGRRSKTRWTRTC